MASIPPSLPPSLARSRDRIGDSRFGGKFEPSGPEGVRFKGSETLGFGSAVGSKVWEQGYKSSVSGLLVHLGFMVKEGWNLGQTGCT